MNSKFLIVDSNQNEIKGKPHFVNVEEDPELYIELLESDLELEQYGFIEPIIEHEPFASIQPIKPLKFINEQPREFKEHELFEILELMSNTPPETDILLETLELMLLKTQSDSLAIHYKSFKQTRLNSARTRSGRYTQKLLKMTPKVMLNRIGTENLQIYLNVGREKEEKNDDNEEGSYSCQICDDKQFVTRRSWNLHMDKFHAETHDYETAKWQKCDACQRKVINLRVHIMKMHLGIDNFKCDECPFETKSASNLTQHYNEMHMNVRFICKYCKKPYTKNESLRVHVFNAHPETLKTCLKCDRKFMNKLSLERHERGRRKMGKCSGTKIKKCTTFNKTSGFKCAICGANFTTYYKRMLHKLKNHKK